ncbi:ATP-binding protein [uncultured Tenacibaculum sp.]|uniref:sensor histidine kinase n=1 Tax=uncultured Tenacibaculum sp. TaxID=174713 RepID=UPI0010438FB4|nr:ATP-binding protein [uncultured Tenacibaculum sp.]TCI91101.1 GHKL domain-containing protein [Tenacibaculum sp. M341]
MNKLLLKSECLKFFCCYILVFLFSNSVFGLKKHDSIVNTTSLQKSPVNTKSTEISLDSGWEFYWKQLINPNEFNNNYTHTKVSLTNWTNYSLADGENLPSIGYATYRLKYTLPEKNKHLSLFIPAIYASSKTWINGKLISEIGKVGTTRSETLHRRYSQIIPLDTNENQLDIVIQTANFYHNKGGIDKPLVLANSEHLSNVRAKRIIADMIFIGCLGFIGAFFLLFYLFYWNKDKAVLFFAFACICLSYMGLSDRYAPLARIFESSSWVILTKIEYVSLFLAGTAASLFFDSIFTSFTHKTYSKVIRLSFYTLSALVIFLPAPHFTRFVLPFLILMMVNLLYVTFIIMKAIIGKRHESILLLVSMILGTVVFCIHIFIFLGKNANAIIYVNFGYVLVFMMLSMLLMNRFSDSFKELEKAKEFALEQKKEISVKSKELSNVNLELKENLKQLESSNSELDSFNHIVSHDLKAPLVAMHTLVTFIEEDLEESLDDNSKNYFELLKGRVSKMSALIDGLLEYSKVARGKKQKNTFSFNELLIEVTEIFDTKNTFVLPEKDSEIFANRIELEHVFQNLISNAIKHNDKEKPVITVGVSTLNEEYLFFVGDNGPGIPEKYHHKIFEMFSKLNNNSEVESTGIGLSIVKKLVSENNGTICVESEKGLGTTIKFSWKI